MLPSKHSWSTIPCGYISHPTRDVIVTHSKFCHRHYTRIRLDLTAVYLLLMQWTRNVLHLTSFDHKPNFRCSFPITLSFYSCFFIFISPLSDFWMMWPKYVNSLTNSRNTSPSAEPRNHTRSEHHAFSFRAVEQIIQIANILWTDTQ